MLKKLHAEHNEKACDFLLTSQNFNDWVITTAFYSAMHYVQNEVFPITVNNITCNNINEYKSKIEPRKTKHEITILLVKRNLPSVKAQYKWLHDACMNARYNHYNTSLPKAELAKQYLQDIKVVLIK